MKHTRIDQATKARKLAAVLLAMLFLSMPLLQGVHLHRNLEGSHAEPGKLSFSAEREQCQICTYNAQIKGKQILTFPTTNLQTPVTTFTSIESFELARSYLFTLQKLSARGPPIFLS